jgi:hypothetical protein
MPVTTVNPATEPDSPTALRSRNTLRWVLVTLAAGIVGILAFCVSLYVTVGKVTPVNAADLTVTEVPGVAFAVDPIVDQYGRTNVGGWVLIDGEAFTLWDNAVVIWNQTTGEAFEAPTRLVRTDDLNAARNEGVADEDRVDYANSGFIARFPTSMIVGPREDYHIFIHVGSNGRDLLIDTGTTLGSVIQP